MRYCLLNKPRGITMFTSKSTKVNTVTRRTSETPTLLNFDHVSNPTTLSDLIENIKYRVQRTLGYRNSIVKFDGPMLIIKAESQTLLVYNLQSCRDVLGQSKYLNITLKETTEMYSVVSMGK